MKKISRAILGFILISALIMPVVASASVESGNGIDASNYQNITNYQSIADSGVEYAYVKATEGVGYTDKGYIDKFKGFEDVGIKVGFYHFFSEWSNPSEQAEYFYNAIKDYQYNLIPCLDVETNQRAFSVEQLSERINEFASKFKELSGQDIIIYTGSWFQRTYLSQEIVSNYKFWIASYQVNVPTVADGTTLVGHQFACNWFVSGVGYVDGNNFTSAIEFNTNESEIINSVTSNISTQVTTDTYKVYREYLGSRCKELQGLLNSYGYSLVVDGDYGACTHKALGNFQSEYLGYVDYLAGPSTFNSLYSNLGNTWTKKVQAYISVIQDGIVGTQTLGKVPILKYGSSGELVKLLQERLNYYGFDCGNIDGYMLSKTISALKAYQRNRGLIPDGVCGKISWRQLML